MIRTTDTSVYFLGAGASCDAGVPLTSSILERIRKQVRNKRGRKDLRRFIEQFAARPPRKNSVEPSYRAPIIELISLLDSSLKEGRPLDHYFTIDKLRKIRGELTVEMSIVIEESKRNKGQLVRVPEAAWKQERGRRVAKYYKKFAQTVKPGLVDEEEENFENGDVIITTNYDTNVDLALYELVYRDDVEISDLHLGSDFRDPDTDQDAFSDTRRPLELLKLHGSLNWLYCPRCCRIYVAAFVDNVRFLHENRKEYKDQKECFCKFSPLEPVIVAPSAFQEIANPHLISVWMRAYHALERSSRWVFAGYSLPPEDIAIRSLLYRAYSARKQMRRPIDVSVVALKGDRSWLKRRYDQLFSSEDVSYQPMPFREFVDWQS